MKDNFFISPQNSHRRHEMFVQSRKTAKYAAKSLRGLPSHLWILLPEKIKSMASIFIFRDFSKTWFETKCNWKRCSI